MDGLKVSQRLRALRLESNLSHAALAKKLKEKYNIEISVQTLKDYERPAINGTMDVTKGSVILGMRIQYLDTFADFYGVSTDYILGRSSAKTPDVSAQAAMQYTGLSNDAVQVLNEIAIAKTEYCANIRKTIDLLLGKEYSENYWFRIYAFLYTQGSDFTVLLPAGSFKVMRDEMLRAILEQNNSFLAGIKSKLNKEEGCGENGKH